jgi:hypothetical protein
MERGKRRGGEQQKRENSRSSRGMHS